MLSSDSDTGAPLHGAWSKGLPAKARPGRPSTSSAPDAPKTCAGACLLERSALSPPAFERRTEHRRGIARQSRRAGDVGRMREPLVGCMKQRHDVEAGQQHPVVGPNGGDKILVAFRRQQRRDHRIDRRRAAPAKLKEASWFALAEPQRMRCSLPGEAEAIHYPIIMSKSNECRRRWILHLIDEPHMRRRPRCAQASARS